MNQSEMMKAISMPTMGATRMNITVLRMGSELMAPKPACAMPAPANPPMSVCEDDEGMPNHQVRRFQKMAATRPEKTITRPT